MTTVNDLPVIYAKARDVKAERQARRVKAPFIRLWDGDWQLRGVCNGEITGHFTWLLNESGTGVLTLPYEHHLAQWAISRTRTTQNIHITVDKDGARWDGRLSKSVVQQDEHGVTTVEMTFLHSYEELKHICVWSNPLLPAALQIPQHFILVGPSASTLKLALFLNVLRLETSLWALPDNPLDINEWFNLDMSNWSIVVKPHDLLSDSSVWTLLDSRFKMFHDLAKDTLSTAQLMITTRRWLVGDPPPWPGANLRNGALVVDIVDKSGFTTGTSEGGSVLDGLVYTAQIYANDFLEQTPNVLPDPNNPAEYQNPGWLGTLPQAPWVIFRPERNTGVQTSSFTMTPFTDVQILTGGHSPALVNQGVKEAITAAGQLAGALVQMAMAGLGDAVSVGGQLAQDLVYPGFIDTLLAWVSYKDPIRASKAGWSHYYEHFHDGADDAYSLNSLIALSAALWATRSFYSHELTVADGQPYFIGDQGEGHFFLGDRVGSTVHGMPPGEIFVDQVTQLELAWARDQTPAWQITIGTNQEVEEPLVKSLRKIDEMKSTLHDLGVKITYN
ncbi:phage tail protein [Nocardia sp. NPDC051030]|uniref:Gp37-like protein n=1 Tax=Nocardia sp. NPDC051030 TaxID=3155162 RepID=UPI0034298C42